MDEVKIDTLTIEIGASSTKAVSAIDNVINSVRRLQDASKHGLSNALKQSIESLGTIDTTGIKTLATALRDLQAAASKVTLSSRLAQSISELSAALKSVRPEDISALRQLGYTLNGLKDVANIRINKNLPEQIELMMVAVSSVTPDAVASLIELGHAFNAFTGLNKININKDFPNRLLDLMSITEMANPENLVRIAQALGMMAEIGTIRIPNKLAQFIRDISTASDMITHEAIDKLERITVALSRLSGVDLRGLSGAMRAMDRLASTPRDSDTEEAGGTSGRTRRIRVDSDDVETASRRVSRLNGLLRALGRIALYRLLRSAIKAVTEAFAEGEKNAYWYSKTVGVETKYIAEAYDNLASASFKMQNQLGSAWASLKVALIPVVLEIVRVITLAANAIAQFFAALSGKSYYLKAIDYTKDWADETNKGSKAAKEWKNQLMGFDEINRLNEPSTGGSSTSKLEDYENMFEEAQLDGWAKKVKSVVSWLEEHLGLVKTIVAAIGIAFGAWKISSGVGNAISAIASSEKLGSVAKTIIGLGLALAGTTIYVLSFINAWKNGPDWLSLAGMLGGLTVAAIGMGIAFGPVAAAVTLIVGGIGMLVVGIKDWIKTGKLTGPTFATIVGGLASIAAGILVLNKTSKLAGLGPSLSKGLSGAAVSLKKAAPVIGKAALGVFDAVMIAYDVYKLYDAASTYHEAMETHNKETETALEQYRKLYETKGKEVADEWALMVYNVDTSGDDLITAQERIAGKIETYWDGVPQNMWDGFKQGWDYYFGADGVGLIQLFKDAFQGVIDTVKDVLGIHSPSTVFDDIGVNIVAGLIDGFTFKWSAFEEKIHGLWDGIKRWWNGLSLNAPSVGTTVNYGGYSHYGGAFASGGFPEDGMFFANSGELVGRFSNGKTAVANNSQITDGIAQAVYGAFTDALSQSSGGGKTEVHVYLDSREIRVGQQRLARATGV